MEIKIQNDLKNSISLIGGLFFNEKERIYLVGGALRDIILGNTPIDLDFTTSAGPDRIKKIVRPAADHVYDKSRTKGYGTQGIRLKNGLEIEITPYRRVAAPELPAAGPGAEAAPPSSLGGEKHVLSEVQAPPNKFGGATQEADGGPITLEEDLASRDFTINAVAMDVCPDRFGEIVDPSGGLEDLKTGRLRTPAPPMRTFEDDPLRALRAARFSAQFGLTPDADLVDAVKKVVRETGRLSRVAPERVRIELEKMLAQEKPSRGLILMEEWGLLGVWLPELERLARFEPAPGAHHKNLFSHTLAVLDAAAELGPPSAPFRFAALLHDIAKPETRRLTDGDYTFYDHEKIGAETALEICGRLKFSNDDTEHVADLVRKHHRLSAYAPDWTDSAVRRALHDLGARYAEIVALSRADITTSLPDKREAALGRVGDFLARVEKLELEAVLNPAPPIDGNEVMELLGIKPGAAGGGPEVGRAVNFLKEKIVSGELAPGDAESARRLVLERAWNTGQ